MILSPCDCARSAVITAAEALFAEEGFDALLAWIAERAGGSCMTLSRHFADREPLGVAIFQRHVDLLQEVARGWAWDPGGEGHLVAHLADLYPHNIGLPQAMSRSMAGVSDLADLCGQIVAVVPLLQAEAAAAGRASIGITPEGLFIVIDMLGGALW